MSLKCAAIEIISDKTLGLFCRMISQRGAQGHHEIAVKHTYSAGRGIVSSKNTAYVGKKQKEDKRSKDLLINIFSTRYR